MPDLLTHVLAGYTVGTLLTMRYDWIRPAYVTIAMAGAASPDLNRINYVLPAYVVVVTVLGVYEALRFDVLPDIAAIPFHWNLLHTLPGSLVVAVVASLLAGRGHRRRVLALFLLGALSHHALDLLLVNPDGRSYALFAPLWNVHPDTPGLYSSRDVWLAPLAAATAGLAKLLRHRHRESASPSSERSHRL